jgi:hypothetical protein
MARLTALGWLAGPTVAMLAGAAAAAPAIGAYVSFVGCPIARDTGPDTDLCFLAEHRGERFGLTNPPDFGNPQLKHRVLVEGRVVEGSSCGAVRLDGRVSVLSELDPGCDQLLPYDEAVRGVAGGVFNSGSPEQRARAQDLARRAEADPALSIEPAIPDPPPPPPVRDLTVVFPFDSDRGSGPDMLSLTALARTAKGEGAPVEVFARRAASKLSDGQVMTERPEMGRRRAEKMAAILTGLGVSPDKVRVRWDDAPAPPAGQDDWRSRRAEIRIVR